ncbi:hypothetical protein GCM10008018_09700 [Paenibacillus marchantiophytorum]|uniref:Response regulatory domain-containing protein n=1 Tax=Paenibacillus marchantiophytorum TaxID=1619310 RepID=A0ABQ2BS37_9BACL|nr:hypothetical protein GCM10008018_09700 [Paenibacillus marchantiophytorum]
MDRKVLLIEDESLIREIVGDYFKREQWIVYEAENGLQALEMLEKLDADLVARSSSHQSDEACRRNRRERRAPSEFLADFH